MVGLVRFILMKIDPPLSVFGGYVGAGALYVRGLRGEG